MTPYLSVIVPTKNRASSLERTLSGLTSQVAPRGGFELIVVDNGSGDGTAAVLNEATFGTATTLKAITHPDGGPAEARNAGVAAAEGKVILLLGDDTEPGNSRLLADHVDCHRRDPDPCYAVLGRITWNPRSKPTSFMRWLEDGGPQFHFSEISAGNVPVDRYFYSSHVSLKRQIFDTVGGFDQRFPFAAVEDTELGVRLARLGIILDYRPELLVLHDHPTTLPQSLRRSVQVGRAAALYNRVHPDHPHPQIAAPSGLPWSLLRLAEPALRVAVRIPLPMVVRGKLWLALHRARYAEGFRLGPPSP